MERGPHKWGELVSAFRAKRKYAVLHDELSDLGETRVMIARVSLSLEVLVGQVADPIAEPGLRVLFYHVRENKPLEQILHFGISQLGFRSSLLFMLLR